jgi:hypothetical protein
MEIRRHVPYILYNNYGKHVPMARLRSPPPVLLLSEIFHFNIPPSLNPSYPCHATYFGLVMTAIAKMNTDFVNDNPIYVPHTIDDIVVQYWVLVTLYFSLGGPNWLKDQNWLSSSSSGLLVCQDEISNHWYGLSCFDNIYVQSIDLMFNNLVGSIPTQIALLSSLRVLNLNGGDLSGTIPTEIGIMKNLTKLLLESTKLTGTIPSEVGSCSRLTEMNLMGVELSGSIPTEIGHLSLLGTQI